MRGSHIERGLLLGVVRCIREDPWVKATSNTVRAVDNYAMLVGLQKISIEENVPLCLINLPMAMCHERRVWAFTAKALRRKSLKVIRKLKRAQLDAMHLTQKKTAYLFEVRNMLIRFATRFGSSIHGLIPKS